MARLEQKLDHIARLAPQHASAALLQTGKDVLEISQQLVPVDTSSLKKSGGVEPVDSHTVQVGYGSSGVFFDGREPSEYASYVEFGTSRSAAQPFLVPAMVRSQNIFFKRLQEEVKKINGVS